MITVSRVRSLMVDQAAQAPITLRRNAIGLREVLFQSITDMAPGAAIAASIPAGAAFAGGSLPLAVLFALIACLFCAVSIAELAKRIPAAGSEERRVGKECRSRW